MESASDVQINSLWSNAMQSSKALDLLSSAYVRRNNLYIHFPYICHAQHKTGGIAPFILHLGTRNVLGRLTRGTRTPVHPEAEDAWAPQPD